MAFNALSNVQIKATGVEHGFARSVLRAESPEDISLSEPKLQIDSYLNVRSSPKIVTKIRHEADIATIENWPDILETITHPASSKRFSTQLKLLDDVLEQSGMNAAHAGELMMYKNQPEDGNRNVALYGEHARTNVTDGGIHLLKQSHGISDIFAKLRSTEAILYKGAEVTLALDTSLLGETIELKVIHPDLAIAQSISQEFQEKLSITEQQRLPYTYLEEARNHAKAYNPISQHRYFNQLSMRELSLLEELPSDSFTKSTPLIKEGWTQDDRAFFIIKGGIEVQNNVGEWEKTRESGDIFGENGFNGQRMANVRATEDLSVMVIEGDVRAELEKNDAFRDALKEQRIKDLQNLQRSR